MRERQIHLGAEALETFEVPVVRVNTVGEITYANKAMLSLVGAATFEGVKVGQWLANFTAVHHVEAELAKRQRGAASTYEVDARRVSDGASVPVSVYAVPEVGPRGVTGSLAFVTNLLEKEVQRAMHQAIETQRTSERILAELDALLRRLIGFDNFQITAISRRRKHLRSVYSTLPNAGPPLRWWRMDAFVLGMIDDDKPKSIDVDELFSRWEAEGKASDPAADAFRQQGYKHILSIPVKQGERTVAFIGLNSKREHPFTKAEIDLCLRLPLAEGALMALQYEESGSRELVIDLIRELTAALGSNDDADASPDALSRQIQKAAEILVQRLAGYFAWEHVAIFRYDEQDRRLRLLKQASHEKFALDEDHSISVDRGLTGRAFRSGLIVNVGNVDKEADYVEGVAGIVSELCVPVPGHPPRWLVNIESKHENAFADEEISIVEMLVREAGNILERAALLEMRHAVLASVNDAVIETDSAGVIRRANPASFHILGERDLIGKRLGDFIAGDSLRERIAGGGTFSRTEAVVLRVPRKVEHEDRGRREEIPAMISGAVLPRDLGGKVFVISDLSYLNEGKRLDLIKEVFRQASLESRAPLALAATYLGRLANAPAQRPTEVERVLKQLRKADLPLERLLRIASQHSAAEGTSTSVRIADAVDSLIEELPEAESEKVEVRRLDADARVCMPRETLAFCVENMLSFALRSRPLDRKVMVELGRHGTDASIAVHGDWTPVLDTSEIGEIAGRWKRKTVEDLTLASGVLGDVARRCGGRFEKSIEDRLDLRLVLPIDAR